MGQTKYLENITKKEIFPSEIEKLSYALIQVKMHTTTIAYCLNLKLKLNNAW